MKLASIDGLKNAFLFDFRVREAERRYYYLASPFTAYPHGHEKAVEHVSIIASWLMDCYNLPIFCPVAHSAPLVAARNTLGKRPHQFWMNQCLPLVRQSSGLIVAELPGWDSSRGVADEIACAETHGIPVTRIAVELEDFDLR